MYEFFLDPSLLIMYPISAELCLVSALAILPALVFLAFLVALLMLATVSGYYVFTPPSCLERCFPLGYVDPSLTYSSFLTLSPC
jgi:hypothetical protein